MSQNTTPENYSPKMQILVNLLEANTIINSQIDIQTVVLESMESLEEAREALDTAINETDIVYYSNAMEFLTEFDPSLQISLELAQNSLETVNSELLATLLLQDMLTNEVNKVMEEMEKTESK